MALFAFFYFFRDVIEFAFDHAVHLLFILCFGSFCADGTRCVGHAQVHYARTAVASS